MPSAASDQPTIPPRSGKRAGGKRAEGQEGKRERGKEEKRREGGIRLGQSLNHQG
jgi:hypothetical protein